MATAVGKTITHYRIEQKIGEGGMGVVYKAHDTRLDRIVALKFLSNALQPGSEEARRFLQEAKILASLSHPHITTIFDVDQEEKRFFIALEYVPGGTLRHKLHNLLQDSSQLPITQIVEYGIQLAQGLAHAHRRGVIHRDVTSANILLTEENEVKITDFGLAKFKDPEFSPEPGDVGGTAPYMSPEQVLDEPLDHRTDIFSLGVVLFELTTGQLPFAGEHPAAIGYSIVHTEAPDPSSLRPDVPATLAGIILKSLAKERGRRYQSADEIVKDLNDVQIEITGSAGGNVVARQTAVRRLTFVEAVEEYPTWASDGSRLVFCREVMGYKKLILRDMVDGTETQLTRGSVDDLQPVWTCDGKALLFVRSRLPDGKLEPVDIFSKFENGDIWRLDLESGREEKFIENAFNPACGPDGSWIAFDASWGGPRRIWMVDTRGRNPRQLTSDVSEAIVHLRPRWSPDGSSIVFQNVERVKFDVRVVNVASGKMDWITDDMVQDVYPEWSRSGKEIFFSSFRSGGLNLWAVAAIAGSGDLHGRQLTTGAGQDVQAAVAPDGSRLVYTNIRLNADIWRLPVDPSDGRVTASPEPLIVGAYEESRGAWSPDGRRIAFNSDRSGEMNIWIYSITDHSFVQVTRGAGGDFQPNWSPDGSRLAFFSARSGRPDLWTVDLNTGTLTQLTSGPSLKINPFYSPDGMHIAYHADAAGRLEPWVMRSDGTHLRKLADMEVGGHFMRWSRDGRSVLFRSTHPSSPGIWTAPLHASEPAFVCIPKGGAHISFSPDHRHVMDVVDHKELWVTPVDGGNPRPVFRFADPQVRIDYPVWSPDGRWVLFDYVRPSGGNLWLMDGIG